MQNLPRVYHPVELWEEIDHNMWGGLSIPDNALEKAIEFTGDHERYGVYMNSVVDDWTISCENALTDSTLNQKAWLGHAACAMALSIPENIIRQAWGHLSNEQRLLANRQAHAAIRRWKELYRESRGLHQDVGRQMLFRWNT